MKSTRVAKIIYHGINVIGWLLLAGVIIATIWATWPMIPITFLVFIGIVATITLYEWAEVTMRGDQWKWDSQTDD
jgi:asparagine N-glycosylation enzyme membrane subunit Stt3